MKKITFKMNADEYYIGLKFKNKKISNANIFTVIMCIIFAIAIVFYTVFLVKNPFLYFFAFLVALLPIYRNSMEKKVVKNNFNRSVILSGEQTLVVSDTGIEIMNGFEKIYCPYGTILGIEDTKDYLIIAPVIKKGVFTISKERYASEELDEIVKILREKEKVEGAKK